MHGDEANQAIKTAVLIEDGQYAYDPVEHHGPALYYFAAWLAAAAGQESRAEMTETLLRAVPAAAGVLTIALLWLLRDALGPAGLIGSATLLALSPALTFYSRYYIQETLLVCFTTAAIACIWRYLRKPGAGWAIGAGVSIGLMHASKETVVIAWAAMAGAAAFAWWSGRHKGDPLTPPGFRAGHAVCTVLAAVAMSVAFFSSFGAHWRGVADSILTYTNYFGKAGEPGTHVHPWHFYVVRLLSYHRAHGAHWSEAFILFAASMSVFRLWYANGDGGRSPAAAHTRFAAFIFAFTLLQAFAYALIPYKTPWNLINFWAPACLAGGIGIAWLGSAATTVPMRATLAVFILAGCTHLGWQNIQANFIHPELPTNPYVYAHTSSGFRKFQSRIDELARKKAEENVEPLIAVIQPDGDYWPLPWYLRRFERVGYWPEIPDPLPNADVFIAGGTAAETLWPQLEPDYRTETLALRPGILRTVFVRQSRDG